MSSSHSCPKLAALVLAVLSLLPARTARCNEPEIEPGFVSLFDGESLAGWEGNQKVFRVEKGAILAGSLTEPIAHNEFLCSTARYADFELRLQARLEGRGRNAGIQFRSERIPNHHEVIGYQCDMGRTGTDHLIWGALYDESRRRKFLAEGEQAKIRAAFKDGDWNEYVIRCEGSRIRIWLNGYQTVDYLEKDEVAKTGLLALQIHGGQPAVASYRRIRLKRLPSAAGE